MLPLICNFCHVSLRLVEEVKEKCSIVLEAEEIYMNTRYGHNGKYVKFVKVYSTDALLYALVIIKIFYL